MVEKSPLFLLFLLCRLAVDGGYTLSKHCLHAGGGEFIGKDREGTFLAWLVGIIEEQISGFLVHCGKPRILLCAIYKEWPAGRAHRAEKQ